MNETMRNNIRSLRVRAGLTQEKMAKELNVSRSQYIIYEKTPTKIKIERLQEMALIFGCDVNDFIM